MSSRKIQLRNCLLTLLCALALPIQAQVDVWPGDANNNGTVNHFDLLHFGLGFSYQGPPRGQKSVAFQAQRVGAWTQNLPDSLNFAYLDCNGNGHISLDDTIAIRLNYNQTHNSPQIETLSPISILGAPLHIYAAFDSVENLSQVNFDINLGSITNPVDSFYGLAFTLNYDAQLIKEGSFSVKLDSSAWINKSGSLIDEVLLMAFEESSEGKLNIALSKTNLINSAGLGKIISISCVIEDNLIGKDIQALQLAISDALLIGNNLNVQAIQTNSKSIEVIHTGIDNKDFVGAEFNIYPNPTQDILNIKSKNLNNYSLNIFGLNGQLHQNLNDISSQIKQLDVSTLPAGVYFLQIQVGGQQKIQKFIKL